MCWIYQQSPSILFQVPTHNILENAVIQKHIFFGFVFCLHGVKDFATVCVEIDSVLNSNY